MLYDSTARKRPVNLTLNESLVANARELTGNLSGVVESLLAEYVRDQRARRGEQEKAWQATISTWNAFADRHGSYADDHSTL